MHTIHAYACRKENFLPLYLYFTCIIYLIVLSWFIYSFVNSKRQIHSISICPCLMSEVLVIRYQFVYEKKKTFQRSVEKYWHLKHGGIKVLPYCWNLASHYGLINYQIDFVSTVILRSHSNLGTPWDACPVMFPCLLSLMLIY